MRPKDRVLISLYVPVKFRDHIVRLAKADGRNVSNFVVRQLVKKFGAAVREPEERQLP